VLQTQCDQSKFVLNSLQDVKPVQVGMQQNDVSACQAMYELSRMRSVALNFKTRCSFQQ